MTDDEAAALTAHLSQAEKDRLGMAVVRAIVGCLEEMVADTRRAQATQEEQGMGAQLRYPQFCVQLEERPVSAPGWWLPRWLVINTDWPTWPAVQRVATHAFAQRLAAWHNAGAVGPRPAFGGA